MTQYIITGAAAFVASLLFGMSLSAPRRTLPVSATLGCAGYLIYLFIYDGTEGSVTMYSGAFFGALAASLAAEVFARTLKTPATVIIFVSIIPLVPGVMLYKTMLMFAEGDYASGGNKLIITLIYTGCLSIAVTVSAMLGKQVISPIFKYLFQRRQKEEK